MLTGIRLKEKSKRFAKFIRGISHAHRLGILYVLTHKPMEAHDIAETIDLPQNLVSFHLSKMHREGWVTKTRIGRAVTYELSKKIERTIEKFFEETPLAKVFFSKNSF